MLLEVFAHKRLVGEMQLIRNLLDTLRGILQQDTHFQNHIAVNPFRWGTLRYLLDNF